MGSITQRQVELIKEKLKMLDWAMVIVSSKKKVTTPKINIFDYIPYAIQPPYEHAFVGPLVSQEPTDLFRSSRCSESTKFIT